MIRKAGALIFEDSNLLIVKPRGKPFFINPGGKYNPGETPEECLRRELNEELTAKLLSFQEYKTYNFDKAAGSNHPLTLELYIVQIAGEMKPSSEIEELAWLCRGDFYAEKYQLAPSFYTYVPDLIRDGLL